MSQSIHHEVLIKASAERIYVALTDAKQFSAFSGGAPAEISNKDGGTFSMFGGMISGRNVELVPAQRLVQAWRAGNWAEGIYSIARFELQAKGSDTLLVFDHTGFPPENRDDLNGGWTKMYWDPIKKYLGAEREAEGEGGAGASA